MIPSGSLLALSSVIGGWISPSVECRPWWRTGSLEFSHSVDRSGSGGPLLKAASHVLSRRIRERSLTNQVGEGRGSDEVRFIINRTVIPPDQPSLT